jgi:hypothetical protein
MGLRGMEERARLMGGTLRVESEPHGGTTVEVSVPILVSDWVPAMAEAAAGERESDTGSVAAVTDPVSTETGMLTRPVP